MNELEALRATIAHYRKDIERSQEQGKIPADYSLGFINALIFVEHRFSGNKQKPSFYDRTTCIGSLPKPVVLATGNQIKDSQTHQLLQDQILIAARCVASEPKNREHRVLLRQAFKQFDRFVEGTRDVLKKAEESQPNDDADSAKVSESQGPESSSEEPSECTP